MGSLVTGQVEMDTNQNPVSSSSADLMFEVLDDGNWNCNNCSTTWPQSESIGRHLYSCLQLDDKNLRDGTGWPEDNENIVSASCCKFCARSFDPPVLLKRHENQCTSRNRIMDLIEGISLKTENLEGDSALPKTRNRSFACKVCNESFTGQVSLTHHTETVHNKRKESYAPEPKDSPMTIGEGEVDEVEVTPSDEIKKMTKVNASKKKPKLKCTHCPRTFDYNSLLVRHLKSHNTMKKPYKRIMCKTAIMSSEKLKAHIKNKHGYKCNICGSRFTRLLQFKVHNRDFHSRRTQALKCATCSMEFTSAKHLLVHLKRMDHESEEKEKLFPFACPKCPARFTLSYNLKRHCVDKHEGSKIARIAPDKPPVAGEQRIIRAADKQIRISVGGLPRVSNGEQSRVSNGKQPRVSNGEQSRVSNGEQSRVSNGKQPRVSNGEQSRVSNGKQPRVSNGKQSRASDGKQSLVPVSCGKPNAKQSSTPVSNDKSNAKQPRASNGKQPLASRDKQGDKKQQTETDIVSKNKKGKGRILYCNVCRRAFLYQSNLKIHMKTHTKTHAYECTTCAARFAQLTLLTRHSQGCKLEFGCAFCSARFVHKREQSVHLKTHDGPINQMFRCKLCPTILTSKSAFNSHLRTHGALSYYECKLCSEKFTTPKGIAAHHQLVHSDDAKAGNKRALRKSVVADK